MSKTKIVVIQMKEIVYTAIFVGLGILLILLLVAMFLPKGKHKASGQAEYIPGVYTHQITLGESSLNVEVVVDKNHINNVSITNLSDSITTMYPIVAPALDDISKQLSNNVSLKDLVISEDYKYTEMLLIQGIETALDKATQK